MRIERINDVTIKFYLTYTDLEERGFKQDELWTNRKKGEEFFWSMMEEVNQEEEFVIEGPLWIQVHAFDKGIEFVVTKSRNDEFMHLPEEESDDRLEYQVNEFLNKAIENDHDLTNLLTGEQNEQKPLFSDDILVQFSDLETVIQFSHSHEFEQVDFEDLLYMQDGKYYYYVQFDKSTPFDIIDGYVAHVFEYADHTKVSHAWLEEYGKVVMSHNVRHQVKRYFKAN
ncbi:adaptor protein MecA [Macrococcus equipercicus]|uniref:Adapter protein MecA n=1 Tax=Macrococcus equipercicus TaxID=69967 RepID=A0A9Q9BWP5_9STAP|nr:adaptor protein MecA [Macrococcus equipercicus]UTH14453.1 adaptor protein MecA [Macrococcus equipercicus]